MHRFKKYLTPIQPVFITNGAGEEGEERMNEIKVNWLFLRGYYKDGNQVKGASVQLRQHMKRTPVSNGRTAMWIKFRSRLLVEQLVWPKINWWWNSWFDCLLCYRSWKEQTNIFHIDMPFLLWYFHLLLGNCYGILGAR